MAIICTVLHICNTPLPPRTRFLYITLLEYRIVHLWCFALENIKKKNHFKRENDKQQLVQEGGGIVWQRSVSSPAWCRSCCRIYLLCRVYKKIQKTTVCFLLAPIFNVLNSFQTLLLKFFLKEFHVLPHQTRFVLLFFSSLSPYGFRREAVNRGFSSSVRSPQSSSIHLIPETRNKTRGWRLSQKTLLLLTYLSTIIFIFLSIDAAFYIFLFYFIGSLLLHQTTSFSSIFLPIVPFLFF